MSNGNWQTQKQKMQLKRGSSITEKIEGYIREWERRCYSSGIPDEVPPLLAQTLRAPSYKAIAMAILRNNVNEIGISAGSSQYETMFKDQAGMF